MTRRKAAGPQLALAPPDETRAREESWSDVEGRVMKHALSSGVRRVLDMAIRVEEWQDPRARTVWSAVLRLVEAGKRSVWIGGGLEAEIAKVETITVARDCHAWIKAAGDEPDPDEVDALVQRMRDRNFNARVCTLAQRLFEVARSGHTEAAARASSIVTDLRDLDETRTAPGSHVELQTAAEGWAEFRANARKTAHGKLPILGIPGIDRWIRMPPATVTVVGAEPSVGKSTISAGAVLATAQRGIPAVLVSVEDAWADLAAKMAATVGQLNPREVLADQPAMDLAERMDRADLALRGLPVYGHRVRDRSLDGVLSAIRAATARGCRLVAVDYLTAIRRPSWLRGMKMDRREWTDEIIAALLAIAAERGVSLIIASQFNRSKDRHAPTLHDLKETSTIGEAAHNAVLLYRGRGDDSSVTWAGIAKIKDGHGHGKRVGLVRDAFGNLVQRTKDDDAKTDAPKDEWGAS